MAIAADRNSDLFIDGKLVPGGNGRYPTINPATEEILGTAADADAEDMSRAIDAARRAFDTTDWSTNTELRVRGIRQLRDAMKANVEELREMTMAEVGAPRMLTSAAQLEGPVEDLSFCADTAENYSWRQDLGVASPMGIKTQRTIAREAVGVVGAITPWNFPHQINLAKLGPALAAGNTIVLKPAELTPLTAVELEKIALEAGLPEGVLNVVVGPGRVVGERMVEHPDVAKIAFTGSTEVGRRIGALASESIKRVTLELGGKSANIVFADADLEKAAASAPGAVFGNAGQDCCARSRILVERSALDRFMEALEEAVDALRVGDPLDPDTQMGPLISADQREKVGSYAGGDAPVAIRGSAPDGPGYWFPPTVLCPVSNDDRAAREEIFGPVAAVIPFDGEDEAVRIANDTIYGLSGSIWTRNGSRAMRVARAVQSGALSVNSNTSVRVTTPFGGFKQSGVGRELGPHALEHYTELKNVYMATD
jgi:aldehyde dehydrogenase (NAD+)